MSERLSSPEDLADIDRELLNNFQHEFPLSDRPWRDLAARTGIDEDAVMCRLQSLHERGYISRIGPVFKCNSLAVSTLAAMSVPEAELEKTAALINSYEGVNHNYERQHDYNLWFVIAAPTADKLDGLLDRIERDTGYHCLRLPMLENFHIDLGFELQW